MNAELTNRLVGDARKIREILYQFNTEEGTTPLETLKSALDSCEKVFTILNHTRSLWQVADYSYKGREICKQAWAILDQIVGNGRVLLREGSKIHSRYRSTRESLRVLEFQYHEDEAQRLGASVSTLTGAGTL